MREREHMHVCARMHMCTRGTTCWNRFSPVMWISGLELRSASGLAASPFTDLTVSLTLTMLLLSLTETTKSLVSLGWARLCRWRMELSQGCVCVCVSPQTSQMDRRRDRGHLSCRKLKPGRKLPVTPISEILAAVCKAVTALSG